MNTDTKGKALFQQTVTVDFIVNVEAPESEFTMLRDELQDAIGEQVRAWLEEANVAQPIADLNVRRGPSGANYFPPGYEETYLTKPDERPIKPLAVSLSDLGFEKES